MPPLCQTTPLSTPVMASNVPIEYSHQRRMNISIQYTQPQPQFVDFPRGIVFAMLCVRAEMARIPYDVAALLFIFFVLLP